MSKISLKIISLLSILFIGCSNAAPIMTMEFHMGTITNGKSAIGGTLHNTGDEKIVAAYINYFISSQPCSYGEVKIFLISSIEPMEKITFTIPVQENMDNYKIIEFGGLDQYGYKVKTKDETAEVIERKNLEKRSKCVPK